MRIEDYALIGDTHTAALVGKAVRSTGSACPASTPPPCFAALLGDAEHGRWLLAPAGGQRIERRYRDGTLVLETDFETAERRGRASSTACRSQADAPVRGARRGGPARPRADAMDSSAVRLRRRALGAPGRRRHGAGPGPTRWSSHAGEHRGANDATVADFMVGHGDSASASCSPGTRRTSRPAAPTTPCGARRNEVVARLVGAAAPTRRVWRDGCCAR